MTSAGAAALAAALVAAASPALGAPSAAPTVDTLIVGRSGVLFGPREVIARARSLPIGRRRCTARKGTPLAVLAAARTLGGPSFRTTQEGGCRGLFVTRIGPDVNRGRDGWVYKVDRRAGTAGAGDPSGPFGNGRRLRSGQRVLWFWCVLTRRSCQRTLEVSTPVAVVDQGQALVVTVTGYDDRGRGKRVAAATVTLGASGSATTGPDGRATLVAGGPPGVRQLRATAAGMVAGFRVAVRVR